MSAAPFIAVTAGEPAGIGPDLCALLARRDFGARIVFLGDRDVIADRAMRRHLPFDLPAYTSRDAAPTASLLHVPVAATVKVAVWP